MTGKWIYERTADNAARFVLGTVGARPLVCVGVNPSTAAPGDPDLTVSKVAEFASRNGFDSWVMLNLYPQRSTDPKGMHLVPDLGLCAENERCVSDLIAGRPLTILAAWGELIRSRHYLPQLLAGIVQTPLGLKHPVLGGDLRLLRVAELQIQRFQPGLIGLAC